MSAVESDTAKRHEGLVMKAADLEQQYRRIWRERDQFSSENEALKVCALVVLFCSSVMAALDLCTESSRRTQKSFDCFQTSC